jgi:hypothetical protein
MKTKICDSESLSQQCEGVFSELIRKKHGHWVVTVQVSSVLIPFKIL